ncbi:MAG: response regulator, partial [Natronospirillum sp.]
MIEQNSTSGRLLVIDDEPDVASTICMMAGLAGYETHHTDDTGAFLESVAAWAPTHVAVDLQLADRDGIEVIHKLAEMRCTAAIIIVSGLGGRILDSAAR